MGKSLEFIELDSIYFLLNLSTNPWLHLENAVASSFLTALPADVAPIVIWVAKSGVILVWKSIDLTKLEVFCSLL